MTHIAESCWIGTYGSCADCGSGVSHYICNPSLIRKRPDAREHNWWAACDNSQCPRHVGAAISGHTRPEWDLRKKNISERKSSKRKETV